MATLKKYPRRTPAPSELVADEVRVMMTRRRVSGTELARRLAVSNQWVSTRLTGRQSIDFEDLQLIAEALGCRIRDLLPDAVLDVGSDQQKRVTAP